MKRIFLLSTVVIASFGMIHAQTASSTPQQGTQSQSPYVNAKKLVSSINRAVNLHGDQFSKVNEVCVAYYEKGATDAQAKSALLDKVKALLTPEQQKSFAAFKF